MALKRERRPHASNKPSLNFDGQKFFLGLDVHKQNWIVTIRSLGIEFTIFSMNPSPQELFRYLQRHYPYCSYDNVYKAGFCGFGIPRELKKLGVHNVVINPADVPTTGEEKSRKNDKLDSRKLARELENGSLTAIYVPDDFHLQALVLPVTLSRQPKSNAGQESPQKFLGVLWSSVAAL
jgi:hypothetical protein